METLNARDCSVSPLDFTEAQIFIERNHRAKSVKGANISLGLYSGELLVGVIQFGYPRTAAVSKKYSAELYRLAFEAGFRVRGGASKLIKHYIREYKPSDFFTYQDTAGENTKVYEHSGMTLVKDGVKTRKQYLVAPGKALETGSRKEVLGMAYATRYGPDRILGTKLGEVRRANGTRKSNKDIFLEDLGWHIEETTGDSIWEWVDTNRTYYTYRITAKDSDKYYYGVSHVKKANASLEDCLNDGYYGSGSKKYKTWKAKHRGLLLKEVLGLFPRRAQAFEAEKQLIGSGYKDDTLSLNSTSGGKMSTPKRGKSNLSLRECPIHGERKFQGDHCRKCLSGSMMTIETCVNHGDVKHRWGKCTKCSSEAVFYIADCGRHGSTKFRKEKCIKCIAENSISRKLCKIHGKVQFRGNSCAKCLAQASYEVKLCAIHGEVKHHGDKCSTCQAENLFTERNCPTHGKTKFYGDSCRKCSAVAVVDGFCASHGDSPHRAGECLRCINAKTIALRECPVHGLSKFQNETCRKCVTAAIRAQTTSSPTLS